MNINDICYIVLNNTRIAQVVVLKVSGNIYTVRLLDKESVFRVPIHRLYKTEDDAIRSLPPDRQNSSSLKRWNCKPDMH